MTTCSRLNTFNVMLGAYTIPPDNVSWYVLIIQHRPIHPLQLLLNESVSDYSTKMLYCIADNICSIMAGLGNEDCTCN